MSNFVIYSGIIIFDPENKTKKHDIQAEWKRTAMVLIDGEICEYYQWFINKRYNLQLNKPLRNAHISFINDRFSDVNNNTGTEEEKIILWDSVKEKYNNKEINVVLDLDVRANKNHWWLNIPEEYRVELHNIRTELGLARPFYGLHMSIGYTNDRNKDHSNYILDMINKGIITS